MSAREGAAVTALSRTTSDVDGVVRRIEEEGGRALGMICDVRNRKQVESVVAETVKTFGSIDILVNNAQIVPAPQHAIEEWTEQEMRETWDSGLLGSWFFMVAVFPHLKKRGGGKIINTCSAAGHGKVSGMVGAEDDVLTQLHGHSVTYRIATGPQQGRKVFTLQTLAAREDQPTTSGRVANHAGFSLHAGVIAEVHQRDKLERLCHYVSRPTVSEQFRSSAWH